MNNFNNLFKDSSKIIFDPEFEQRFVMNEAAAEIVALIIEKKTKDEIVNIIAIRYGMEEKDAYIEINSFLRKLKIFKILGAA